MRTIECRLDTDVKPGGAVVGSIRIDGQFVIPVAELLPADLSEQELAICKAFIRVIVANTAIAQTAGPAVPVRGSEVESE